MSTRYNNEKKAREGEREKERAHKRGIGLFGSKGTEKENDQHHLNMSIGYNKEKESERGFMHFGVFPVHMILFSIKT